MALRVPLVIHERRGEWARRIAPEAKLAGWPVRLFESRSRADLFAAVGLNASPLVVLDLGDRPRECLEDLDALLRRSAGAMVLLLDPHDRAEVARIGRELGATQVLGGWVQPPALLGLLSRWVPLAYDRCQSEGWAGTEGPSSDPIDELIAQASTPAASP